MLAFFSVVSFSLFCTGYQKWERSILFIYVCICVYVLVYMSAFVSLAHSINYIHEIYFHQIAFKRLILMLLLNVQPSVKHHRFNRQIRSFMPFSREQHLFCASVCFLHTVGFLFRFALLPIDWLAGECSTKWEMKTWYVLFS